MHLLCADNYTLLLVKKDEIQRYFHVHVNKLCDKYFFKIKKTASMGKISVLC